MDGHRLLSGREPAALVMKKRRVAGASAARCLGLGAAGVEHLPGPHPDRDLGRDHRGKHAALPACLGPAGLLIAHSGSLGIGCPARASSRSGLPTASRSSAICSGAPRRRTAGAWRTSHPDAAQLVPRSEPARKPHHRALRRAGPRGYADRRATARPGSGSCAAARPARLGDDDLTVDLTRSGGPLPQGDHRQLDPLRRARGAGQWRRLTRTPLDRAAGSGARGARARGAGGS